MIKGVRSGKMCIELHKLEREIKMHGSRYCIYREAVDEYKEDTGQLDHVCNIVGLFHISKGYITNVTDDGAKVRTKGQPKLLTLLCDCVNIKTGDVLYINSKKYKVTDINNIEEMNVVCDLSLEVVLDGN